MITIKKKIFILISIIFLSSPIFIYYNNFGISLSNCIRPCLAFQPITLFLSLLIFFLILKNRLLLFLFFFFFIFEIFFYIPTDLNYLRIKSIVPFFFLAGFILMKKELKNYLSFIKFLINIFFPYSVIFFQILIFFSEIPYLLEVSNTYVELKRKTFFNIEIYNYEQYFSFILVLVSGIRLFLISKKKEEFFLASLMILGPYHAVNYNALICSILIILFKIFFVILPKNEKSL